MSPSERAGKPTLQTAPQRQAWLGERNGGPPLEAGLSARAQGPGPAGPLCAKSRNSRCLGQELSLTGWGVLGVGMEEARLRHSEVGQPGGGWGHSWWGPVDQ